jgi:photosystem II stability/assembly factor-like uncharacterized protein
LRKAFYLPSLHTKILVSSFFNNPSLNQLPHNQIAYPLKKALLPFFGVLLIFSCKKNRDGDTPAPKPDSLGTGWTKIATGAPASITDVFFIGNTGFCIASNIIYKSSNGGDSWLKVFQASTGSTSHFENIGMGSPDMAGFVGGSGSQFIFYTSNGGTGFDSTMMPEYTFYDIFYVSPQVVYAINGKLWKSTNGGKSWTSIYTFPGSSITYETLFFLNEQVGWARSHSTLFKTVNGGVDWTPITNHGLPISSLGSIFFIDQNNGYYSNEKTIKRTTDGGANWSTLYTSPFPGSYHDVHFFTPQTGYITDNNLILKTIDGGATWTREVAMTDYRIIELHFTDANHGWAGSDRGIILKYLK